MTKEEKLRHCQGCRNDFYNGKNPYKIKECFSLKSAELMLKKEVYVNQIPPWNQEPRQILSCYHKEDFIYVDPNTIN